MTELETLARQASSGDSKALEALLTSQYDKLYCTALKYTYNHEDALDAIQEACCKTFLSIYKLKQPAYVMTWITKILIRECYKLLKKKNKTIPYEGNDITRKLNHSQENYHTEHRTLTAAIENLDGKYQSAIILHYYHNLSIKEVALVMKKNESTIKSYLRRARKRMKTHIERSKQIHEETLIR
ncbi:sigma-70 family RNA polymerase sigma factor [Shouchella patagoniensis]|uniref:sigma-70 family RNA polymerase sigma factor n=1 Tax=Shouchella patagoniensis TaxID=228576 RepID=UPI000994AD25|nr:sigma-70 family RNA polymerase sigma factor [Shouchella patagoniensis]